MNQTEPNAYRRIWAIIEALAGASVSDDPVFAARLATSEELSAARNRPAPSRILARTL